jgi:hypothetical protein
VSAGPVPSVGAAADVLSSPRPPDQPRAGRPWLIVAGSFLAVVALVLAGAGVKRLVDVASGSGVAPATEVPAGAFAYAQVDLDPSLGQKLALLKLSRAIPNSPTKGVGVRDLRDTVLRQLVRDTPLSYDDDIKPWLGDSIGVAAFADASGTPQGLVVAAVSDKGSATTSLRRLAAATHAAYAFRGGFALVARSADALSAAQAALAKGALSGEARFKADVASLPGGEVVLGWADTDAMRAAVRNSTVACAPAGLGPLCALRDATGQAAAPSRLVFGARAAGSAIELQVRTRGGAAPSSRGDVSGAVAGLPSDTTVAMGSADPGRMLMRNAPAIRALFGLAAITGGSESSSGAAGVPVPVQGRSPQGTNASFRHPVGTSTGAIVNAAWASPGGPSTPVADGSGAVQPAAAPSLDRSIRQLTGLTFPGDFVTLLGDQAVLAVGPRGGESVQVALRTHPANLTRAARLADRLSAHSARQGTPLSVTTGGGYLVLASSGAYARHLTAASGLGGTDAYRAATGSTAGATFLAFVNVSALAPPHASMPVRAVGVVGRQVGGDELLTVRVVVGG